MADDSKNQKVDRDVDYNKCSEPSNKPEVSQPQNLDMQQLMNVLCKLDQNINSIRKEQTKLRNEVTRVSRGMAGMRKNVSTLLLKANGMKHQSSKKPLRHVTSYPLAKASTQGFVSESDEILEICLKEGVEELVENLDLVKTQVLDGMLEEKCLTEEEETSIRKHNSRKDQVRKFVALLSKRSKTHFDAFIKIIKKPQRYPELANMLTENYQKLKQCRQKPMCLRCSIQNKVEIRDVVDKLCHYSIVDTEFLGKCTDNNNKDLLWDILFDSINNSESPKPIEIFRKSLEAKHDNLAKKVEAGKKFICNCETVERTTHQNDSDTDQSISGESWSARSTSHVDESSSQNDSSDDDAVNTFSTVNLAEQDDAQGCNDTKADTECPVGPQNKYEKEIGKETDDTCDVQYRASTDMLLERTAQENSKDLYCVEHNTKPERLSPLSYRQECKAPMKSENILDKKTELSNRKRLKKVKAERNAGSDNAIHPISLGDNAPNVLNEDTDQGTTQETCTCTVDSTATFKRKSRLNRKSR